MRDSYFTQMIDLASEKAGGVTALSRALGWNLRALLRVRAGERISPYRAAKLAEYLGNPPALGIAVALEEQSKTEGEREYWRALFDDEFARAKLAELRLIENVARQKSQTAGADSEKYKRAADEARASLDEFEALLSAESKPEGER